MSATLYMSVTIFFIIRNIPTYRCLSPLIYFFSVGILRQVLWKSFGHTSKLSKYNRIDAVPNLKHTHLLYTIALHRNSHKTSEVNHGNKQQYQIDNLLLHSLSVELHLCLCNIPSFTEHVHRVTYGTLFRL